MAAPAGLCVLYLANLRAEAQRHAEFHSFSHEPRSGLFGLHFRAPAAMIMPEWWCAPAVSVGWHYTLALPVHGVARGAIRFAAQQPGRAPVSSAGGLPVHEELGVLLPGELAGALLRQARTFVDRFHRDSGMKRHPLPRGYHEGFLTRMERAYGAWEALAESEEGDAVPAQRSAI